MASSIKQALGHIDKPLSVGWNQRDLLLYAVSVGFKENQLPSVYELHPDWTPVPLYPLVLGLKGDSQEVTLFAKIKDAQGAVPGLPPLDPNKIVHATQGLEIVRAIPARSGPGWKLTKKTTSIKDTGKGLIIEAQQELQDASGTVYARLTGSSYNFGNFNTGFSGSVADPPFATPLNKAPTRAADIVLSEKISPQAAILYRLNSDYNPLHIDPEIGKRLGFGGVILHGLATYGNVGRQIITEVAKGNNKRLKYIFSRFTSPVRPGDEIETKLWTSPFNEKGVTGTRVDFVVTVKGKPVLGPGVAVISDKDLPSDGSSKL